MRRHNIPALVAKMVIGLVSIMVVSVTGYAWASMKGLVDDMVFADVIGDEGGGELPADGSRDILLVGLDSRTDAHGNPLTKEELRELGAGGDGGELNTDTLILVHIPNDGSGAVAVSIPRDSYVEIPDGYGQHKINSAYGRGKTVERQRLEGQGGLTEQEIETGASQEGAKVLIATIERLTGRTIDNYASINLHGFSEITKAIGGVPVCLKNDVYDEDSKADFTAGYQVIQGREALAFVRQRYGLPRGDLDRVVRQQVFMAGMARKVLSAGTLTNPSKLNDLMDAITRAVVLDRGWDILAFAQQMSGLTGGQIEFRTIPIVSPELHTPGDGVAVEVDPAQVQQFINGLFGDDEEGDEERETKAANAEITVNVLNTTETVGLAGHVAQLLTEQGFSEGRVADSDPRPTTIVRHASGEEAHAKRIVDALGGAIETEADPGLPAGVVSVLIGPDFVLPTGGGNNPAGEQGQPTTEPPADQTTPAEPPADDGLNSDEPITAEGVTCVN